MESVLHLFFEFAVAAQLWCVLSEILKVNLGGSFESIGQFWLSYCCCSLDLMEAMKWPLFSECWLERDGYPAEQNCLYGAELANPVPGEQEGFFFKNSVGDQEEREKLQVVDRMQNFLKMKPELVTSSDALQVWSSCRLAWVPVLLIL